ncbi:MAG: ATP-dependent helicase [Pirellulales bacterium]|nr:ATP-dependent helicase [Pirellulales bacterium]
MKLTNEQKLAINHEGNAVVVACPGSGKTRAIVAKLLKCVESVQNSPRKVACITYTNAAVHEIESRIRTYGSLGDEEYCEVATIHSFCLNNVLRHFHWMLDDYHDGFSILPSESEEYKELATLVCDDFDLDPFARQQFESLNRRPTGEPLCPEGIPPAAAAEFWRRLQAAGYIDFCNIVYYTFRLLADNHSLVSNLSSRFAYLLVDEFQDTSALQFEILKRVSQEHKSSFFVVGDPEQSIFRFAGAEPDLMLDFANQFSATEFPLSGNFRSSRPIVDLAESLICRKPKMEAVGESAECEQACQLFAAEHHFASITDYFLPALDKLKISAGNAAILAQNWFQLRPLGQRLRDYGVPVVGPGARPYKKRHLLASLAEQVCAYVENPLPEYVARIERELFFLVQAISGKANFRVFSFGGRRSVIRLLREGQRLRERYEGAQEWLVAAGESFGKILTADDLLPQRSIDLLSQSAHDILGDMQRNDIDIANLTLDALGMFADPARNLKLLTMHSAKGREFEAVAVIAVHDGIVPFHNNFVALTAESLAESRRLLYVAITRARRLLMLFTNQQEWRPPSRFLEEMGFYA